MGEIPQEGGLAQLPVPRLLLALRRERYDGLLRLTRDRVEKRVVLQRGVPVFAESNLPSESLGVQLLDDGRIDREQHARVSQLVQDKGVKEGAALLELEILSPREIFDGLKDQVRRRILGCFAWPDGCYALESHAELPEDAQAFRTDPLPLVFEGLLRHWGTDHLVGQLTIRLERYPHRGIGEFQADRKKLQGLAPELADATHIRLQHPGNANAAVFALKILHYSYQRAPHSQTGAVQGMQQFRLARFRVAPSRLHPARLIVSKAAAGGNLPVGVLGREPDLQVVGLPCRKTEVSGTKYNLAVGQFQQLQDLLRVSGKLL